MRVKEITLSAKISKQTELYTFLKEEKQRKASLSLLPAREKKEDESWKLFLLMALDRYKREK